MLHSFSFSSESFHDVRHSTQVSIEAEIRGVKRRIYSILLYTKRHSARGSGTRPFNFILHVTITLHNVLLNILTQSIENLSHALASEILKLNAGNRTTVSPNFLFVKFCFWCWENDMNYTYVKAKHSTKYLGTKRVGHTVAQVIKALRCNSARREFDSRWCH
jgi:hypothetical protein